MSKTTEAGAAIEAEGARDWIAPAVIAACGFVAVCAVCWPGFMSPDSVEQLRQARDHIYSDDHPPLMAMIWAVADRLLPGPAGMLLLLNALYWGGLLVCARYWPLPRRARTIAFALVAAFPPLLVNLGVIWKDILMQGALVCVLAAYLRYRRSHGLIPLAVALVFSVLAIAARHNAAAAVWPLLVLFAAEHPRWSSRLARWKRWLGAMGISLALVAVMQQGITRSLAPFVKRQTHFWQVGLLFDLAGMSVVEGELLFDPGARMLRKGVTIGVLSDKYNPRHPGSIFYGRHPVIKHTDDPDQLKAIAQNWARAIRQHPRAYLVSRWRVYRNLLGLSSTPPAYMVFAEIHKNKFGYALAPSPLRDRTVDAFELLAKTPLFRVWLYVFGGVLLFFASAAAFWFGGAPLALGLSLSGLIYHLTFALLSCSDDYRYSLWTITCTVLSACALPASLPEHWRARVSGLLSPRWAASRHQAGPVSHVRAN
ncbi:MAG TPA: hypothetical protein VFS67_19845 [Polyangiaceae bacterium]|nr:hypothetical protein [Polyangiaceae bacterium]